jgi:hypothetical protein
MALSADLRGALALDVLPHALLSDLPLCALNNAQYMAAHTGEAITTKCEFVPRTHRAVAVPEHVDVWSELGERQ